MTSSLSVRNLTCLVGWRRIEGDGVRVSDFVLAAALVNHPEVNDSRSVRRRKELEYAGRDQLSDVRSDLVFDSRLRESRWSRRRTDTDRQNRSRR